MTTGRKASTRSDHQERILRVLVHLQRNLDEAVSLEDLARVAAFSPFHFHRVFRGMVGESVKEHVRRLRLERAAHRLKHTANAVVRIAFEAGYEAHEPFTRAFKARFGLPPSAYRRRHQPIAYPQTPSDVHYDPSADLAGFVPLRPDRDTMDIKIERFEAMRVAFIRHVGPYDQVGETWSKLMQWAWPKGHGGGGMFGLAYDDPDVTPQDKFRYDACVTVGPDAAGEGAVGIQTIDAGDFAVATHRGPYHGLGEAYAAIMGAWAPHSGRTIADPPTIERYLNDPRSTPEADLLTEIRVRLL